MKIDLEKVAAKIRMLEALREIASNPEMAALLNDVVVPEVPSKNSNRLASPDPKPEPQPQEKPEPRVFPPAGKFRKGALTGAVLEAASLQQKPFSSYELTDFMRENSSYTFTAADPNVAVNDVLRNETKKGKNIRLHTKGKGSSPNLYVWTGPGSIGQIDFSA